MAGYTLYIKKWYRSLDKVRKIDKPTFDMESCNAVFYIKIDKCKNAFGIAEVIDFLCIFSSEVEIPGLLVYFGRNFRTFARVGFLKPMGYRSLSR